MPKAKEGCRKLYKHAPVKYLKIHFHEILQSCLYLTPRIAE